MLKTAKADDQSVLVPTDVSLGDLASQGKNFNWNRPQCDCGCQKVWGHGFVRRFFAGLAEAVFLKRYRCPWCGKVFTLLPLGYGRRLQTAISVVYDSIESRIAGLKWPEGLPRQRGGHWLRRFIRVCRMNFPDEPYLATLLKVRGNGIHFFGED